MKDLDKAIMYAYKHLYANATPPADFDKLLDEAPLNEHGQKVIDFMAYEIEEDVHDRIMQHAMKKYKIKHKILKNAFKFTIDLGCSPRIKTNENGSNTNE
jgi:predicted nucleotide-binding protein (sugar kinase/HSP70/actin superfamily)